MDTVITTTELKLRRVIAAPREGACRTWTEADGLSAWFGPNGVSARITELDPDPADANAAK